MYYRTDLKIVVSEPQKDGTTLLEGVSVDGTRMMFAMRLGEPLVIGDYLHLSLKLDLDARAVAPKGGRIQLGAKGAVTSKVVRTPPQETDDLDDFVVERNTDSDLDIFGPPVPRQTKT